MYNFTITGIDYVRAVHTITGEFPDRRVERKIHQYALMETLQYHYPSGSFKIRKYKIFKALLENKIIEKHKILMPDEYGDYYNKTKYWFHRDKLLDIYNVESTPAHAEIFCKPASQTFIETMSRIAESSDDLQYLYSAIPFINYNQLSINSDRHFTVNKDGQMRFTPKGKTTAVNNDELWVNDNKYRQDIKIGKGLRKMFQSINYPVTDKMIEILSNKIKARYTFVGQFSIVKGEDIRTWYHGDNYAKNQASLSNSCMRYSSCQDFFDIYAHNPNTVSMVIAKDQDNLLIGRALLWHTNEDIKVMDRIYGNDITIQAFKNYAHKNGYAHKLKQDYNSSAFVLPNGTILEDELTITLENKTSEYPYMDTFKYTDDFENSELELSTQSGEFTLESTDGAIPNTVVLHDGDRIHEDQARYVESEGEYYHEDDVVYSEWHGEYLVYDLAIEIDGSYFMEDADCICYAEDYGDYRLTDDCAYSEIDGCWYYEYTECAISGIISQQDSREIEVGDKIFVVHYNIDLQELYEHELITEEEYETNQSE